MLREDKDYTIPLFLRIWAGLFGPLGCIAAFFTGFSIYLLYAAIVATVIGVPIFLIISWTGNTVGNVFHGQGTQASRQEQLKGEVDKANFLLRQEKYDKALKVINPVLEELPEFAEALLIKAKLEIFTGRPIRAKRTLERIIIAGQRKSKEHRWAYSMLKDLEAETTKKRS